MKLLPLISTQAAADSGKHLALYKGKAANFVNSVERLGGEVVWSQSV